MTEYKKTAGINLCEVIKYFKIKKTTTMIVVVFLAQRLIFSIKKVLKKIKWIKLQSTFMLCFANCSCKYFISVSPLKDPKVRPSARNSLGKSFQSFAPVNLKVD